MIPNKIAIAIHGGAGTILKSEMTDAKEQAYTKALKECIAVGYAMLKSGASAIEAVAATVVALEDEILFNAGRGSVFTHKGNNEMDASLMRGDTLEAGAVAGVRNVRNPIMLAQAVMQHSGHVMLSGKGASEFALKMKLPLEDDAYFFSQEKYDQWLAARNSDTYMLDHISEKKKGTVGAVARDATGTLAAATSTGGMTNKKYSRIGDTPIIGAGTYANNATCGISCTGHGELFIRCVVAHDVSCLMEYKGLSLQQACDVVVKDKLVKIGGEGGLIAVDHAGNTHFSFNSEGMYRAAMADDGDLIIGIYK
jgi:beta-aspartyl-peptidase (threonine type)